MNIRFRSICLLFALAAVVNACSEPPPPAEQQIRENIDHIIKAIENLDYDELEKYIDGEIRLTSENKALKLNQVKKLFAVYSFRKINVKIVATATEVQLDKYNTNLASMETNVLITGSKGLLPKEGRLYHVKGSWRLFDDEWKLVKVSWK